MLDRCIALFNCGTLFPMWTEDAMPSDVGRKHKITAYITRVYDCRFEGRKLEVMRCSWNTYHDLIYKYVDKHLDKCAEAFCGVI